MFDIYKFEFDCGFIDANTVRSYVTMGILSQADCDRIVGEAYVAPQAQPSQPAQ